MDSFPADAAMSSASSRFADHHGEVPAGAPRVRTVSSPAVRHLQRWDVDPPSRWTAAQALRTPCGPPRGSSGRHEGRPLGGLHGIW